MKVLCALAAVAFAGPSFAADAPAVGAKAGTKKASTEGKADPKPDSAAEQHEHHGAHVHGEGKLTIALESATQGTLDLDAPADGIVGFEHEAKSASDKKTLDGALKKLNGLGDSLLTLPAEMGCKITGKTAELERGHEKGHADVNASWDLNCKQPLTGAKGKLHLMGAFPKMHKLHVQVIGPAGQSEAVHTKDGEEVAF